MLAAYGLEGFSGEFSLKASSVLPRGRSPYTSSVEIWWKRPTPNALQASSSVCTPKTLLSKNTREFFMLLSTWLSAAKFMTKSNFPRSNSEKTRAPSAMSPCTNVKSGYVFAMLSVAGLAA